MKYFLSVHKPNFIPYYIHKFNHLPGLKKLDDTSLQGIVDFTTKFDSKSDLMLFLINNNLLPRFYSDGIIGINCKQNKDDDVDRILQLNVPTKSEKKFFRIDFLQQYYFSHFSDEEFKEKFIDKFYKRLHDIPKFSKDLEYINTAVNSGNWEYLCESIYSFIDSYTHTHQGGSYSPSFRRICDLALPAISFEHNLNSSTIRKTPIDISQLKMMLEHYKTILSEETLTEDEQKIYENQINNLTEDLENIDEYKIRR